ncbi:hypothetical protein CORT_0E02060 [Candida orthopsilosis Co 90-125]|uniref:Uncharacterized protein n=1 Tax=Candida orthopsilosis (strain 90-125) TaxID=1136231 RepID=H8X7L0_CANO9|nr:hypothetical protein CORT_0E02060 [Candida orthopsilosis Co 90-125]CCG23794.1 hypothetical protein CORT_0E02060 [Candida orthopsilosis Co 90-125]
MADSQSTISSEASNRSLVSEYGNIDDNLMTPSDVDIFNVFVNSAFEPVIPSITHFISIMEFKEWIFRRVFTMVNLIGLATTFRIKSVAYSFSCNFFRPYWKRYFNSNFSQSSILSRLFLLEMEHRYVSWMISWENQREQERKGKVEKLQEEVQRTNEQKQHSTLQEQGQDLRFTEMQRTRNEYFSLDLNDVRMEIEQSSQEYLDDQIAQSSRVECQDFIFYLSPNQWIASTTEQENTGNRQHRVVERFRQGITRLERQWQHITFDSMLHRSRRYFDYREQPLFRETPAFMPLVSHFLPSPYWMPVMPPDRIFSESRPPMVLEHDEVNDFSPSLRPWLLCSSSIESSIDDLPRYTLTPRNDENLYTFPGGFPPDYHSMI